jgi:hypothetical protein
MATQYTSILKLALPTQGELSGTWGDVVNDNITSMVEEAIAGRSVINSWAANSHTLTTADGLTSESRAAMLEFTDTGTALSGAATVICPTATKIYVCKNGAGQTVTVKTAAGTGVAIPNGETMFVFCDGTNVVQAVTSLTTLKVGTGIQVSTILDEDNMASDSATALATQQSIKAYVDAQITAQDLDFAGDTGTGAVDLDSQTFTVAGTANEIETSASGQTITIGLPTAIVVTTITTTNVQATNIKANDGTAAITIADSTGQVTVTDAVLTTADINGGTADNVTIGGSTAAAGSFTTLGASGTTTLSGALALTGNLDINTNKFNVTAVDGNTLIAGTLGVTGNVDLNGGAIDGTVIGGSTAAAVTGTTIVANTSIEIAGTTTVSSILDEDNMASDSDTALATQQSIKAYVDSQVGTVDTLAEILANGNTSGATDLVIDSGQVLTTNTINETTAASGVTIDSVLLKDDGVNATNLEITNLKANDGTSAGSIADSTGVVTLASSVLTTTDINGGTIDGTVIGGSSAAAVTGTTITGTSFVSSGDMTFGDDDKAIFGAGSDLQIYHNGSDSYIDDAGTGNLFIRASNLQLRRADGSQIYLAANTGAEVALYHAGNSKLATTSTGIDVTGTVTATGTSVFASLDISGDIDVDGTTNLDVVDIDGAVDMASTLTVSGLTNLASPVQVRNATQNFNGGLSTEVNSGIINFGLNEGSANRFGGSYTQANQGGFMHFDTRSGEPLFQLYGRTAGTADASGSILFQIDSTGNTVFNETGVDADFRVESSGSSHALFVEGDGTGVGINTSDPQEALHVTGSVRLDGNNNGITSGEAVNQLIFKDTDTTTGGGQTMGQIDFVTADADAPGVSSRISGVADSSTTGQGRLTLFTGAAGTLSNNITMAAGSVAINEAGADMDFRVESDTNANMLFVDASVDRVGVGATPMTNGSTFQVTSDSTESTNMQLTLRGASDTNKQMIMGFDTTANTAHITTQIAGSAPTPLIFKTGNVVFNEPGSDFDFRVESDTNTHALFVQGSDGNVGIGTSSPSVPLDIKSANSASIKWQRTGVSAKEWGFVSDNDQTYLYNFTDGITSTSFNNNGNVGIGTISPSKKVSLADSVNGYNLELQQTSAYNSGNQSGIVFSAPYNIGGSVTDLASIRGGKENATDEDFGGKLAFYTRANGGSDTERMRIDSGGRVTMPYQPAFNVNPLSDQNNIAINTPVTVIFNTEVFDVGSNFASNTFTAPVTGKYQLNLALRLHNIDTAADFYQIKFLTSNRSYLSTADYGGLSSNPNYWTEAFSVLADMDANDTVSITVSQSGGSVQTDIHVETTFSGYLVA